MTAADLMNLVLETTLAVSVAIAIVLPLRRRLRRTFGPGVAYAAWALVPAALLAVLLPAREASMAMPTLLQLMPTTNAAEAAASPAFDVVTALAVLWSGGVLVQLAWVWLQQHRFQQALGPLRLRDDGSYQANAVAGLPAVLGLLRPRIVVPADFDSRYSDAQRELMRLHERTHINRGDLHANAGAALLRCLFWFNPLVHAAARCIRHDQELACDQSVVDRHPQLRRAYGEAMLHTQLASQPLPLGCHWGFSHPLRERIEMLKQPGPTRFRWIGGSALVITLTLAFGFTAWAMQPTSSGTGTPPLVAGEHTPPPKYPTGAAEQGIGGRVVLIISMDAQGRTTDVKVEHSEPAGVFDQAAIEAARHWTFNPAVENGMRVPGRVRVPVDFAPDKPAAEVPSVDIRPDDKGQHG
jgi:TonB family protein